MKGGGPSTAGRGRKGRAALGELAAVLVVAIGTFVVAGAIDAHERLESLVERYDYWQLDEIFAVAFVVVITLAIFALRRWLDLKREVSHHEQTVEKLRDSERLYRVAIESARDSVHVKDAEGRYIIANQLVVRNSNLTVEELVGKTPFDLYPPETARKIREDDLRVLQTGTTVDTEETYDTPHGIETFDVRKAPLRDDDGRVVGIFTIARDITERKRHEDELAYLASHDPLTGLPTRHSLDVALEQAVDDAKSGRLSVLLHLDLDNFKLVNDTFGHLEGDHTMAMVAKLLRMHLRSEDLLVRVSGDEFDALLSDTELEEAYTVAERLRQTLTDYPFSIQERGFDLGVSIGLVPIVDQEHPHIILAQADAAMYKAKARGRNRCVVYRPEEDNLAWRAEANRWVVRIKQALRAERFVLHYQPIVRLCDGQIEHHEALIRMLDEDGRLIPPSQFIPVAEGFGLMPELGRWVLREVIGQLRSHPRAHIFMNLSAHCVADETLLGFVEEQLGESGVEPRRLGFELTETALVHDLVEAERWMRRLKARGCRFALDDFGAGFNSFVSLRDLPLDFLKLDGSLVRTIATDLTQRALVQGIQTIARVLGKEVIAEYVEDEKIVGLLRELGVTYGQGYYFGRPEPTLPEPLPRGETAIAGL